VRGIDQTLVDEVWRETALGLCFLLFKILDRSLGYPFPLLSESRIQGAHQAVTEWLDTLDGLESDRVLETVSAPGHPTLPAYIIAVFYGVGAEGCDERVRAAFALMLRTLTDALDVGQVEA